MDGGAGVRTRASLAGSDSWAEFSDVTQYVPLAWAAAQTFHARDTGAPFNWPLRGSLRWAPRSCSSGVVNEKRPNYQPGNGKRSFPSGHVAKAWFAAAHLQRRYGCYEL